MAKVIIASNRLPVVLNRSGEKFKAKRSVGGLAKGLAAFFGEKKLDYLWIGWPGTYVKVGNRKKAAKALTGSFNSKPVFLSQTEISEFYIGFCNEIIWPLFHYFPSKCRFEDDYWRHYREVNRQFADEIIKNYQSGDIVFIQDYHLMLVPELIRREIPDAQIAFFLHIPFPSFEIFRTLPSSWRIALLEGLLGSDIIGFHTQDYADYFLDTLLRILGLTNTSGTVLHQRRLVKVSSYPLGINFEDFHSRKNNLKSEAKLRELKPIFNNKKVILSVDRLDYTKGIIKRLEAFSYFLDHYPQYHQHVAMIVIAVPSRSKIHEYKEMREQISRKISEINGRYGTIGWLPIIYQLKSYGHDELKALYKMSDISLVTPLRDGMNLIAKEYVASLEDGRGVLILSELAGVAKELRQALIINPHSTSDTASAIAQALEMPVEEQKKRNFQMQKHLKQFDVNWWFEVIYQDLTLSQSAKKVGAKPLAENKNAIIQEFAMSQSRTIFLDYDGTLVEHTDHPEDAKPDKKLLKMLNKFSSLKNTRLIIISGRDSLTLHDWLRDTGAELIAEHGALTLNGGEWQLTAAVKSEWKPFVKSLMKKYTQKINNSFIEEKRHCLAWHTRNSDPLESSAAISELKKELQLKTSNMKLHIMEGNEGLEVKNAEINKGSTVEELLGQNIPEFILAIGDDLTDEEMFLALKDIHRATTIRIGEGPTSAKIRANNSSEVLAFLSQLTKAEG